MTKRHRVTPCLPVLSLTLGILLAASGSSRASSSGTPHLALENFFLGALHGSGTSQDPEHGARTISFSGTGTRIAGGLQLAYDVVFSDGEREHKVWTFIKTSEGHYIGRRDDVVGDAQITQSGDDMHMSYTAKIATKGGVRNLGFDEHFTLTNSGAIINQLSASYLFLPVGSGEVTIYKTASGQSHG